METPDQNQLTDYSPDGVDLTLIRWMLSLTPAQRIEFLEQHVNDILAISELNARTQREENEWIAGARRRGPSKIVFDADACIPQPTLSVLQW